MATRTCSHLKGHVIHDPRAADAFDHPATWCPHCRLWVRHEAYPPPEAPRADDVTPTE
jgi:hypothetical protein